VGERCLSALSPSVKFHWFVLFGLTTEAVGTAYIKNYHVCQGDWRFITAYITGVLDRLSLVKGKELKPCYIRRLIMIVVCMCILWKCT
jgi:hypothetical protein